MTSQWLDADEATSHYLNKWWFTDAYICITQPQWVKASWQYEGLKCGAFLQWHMRFGFILGLKWHQRIKLVFKVNISNAWIWPQNHDLDKSFVTLCWIPRVSQLLIGRPVCALLQTHYDIIKWKHIPCCWQFMRGIHRSPVNSLHKGQWCGALMFSLICAWINSWVNNREAGDLKRHCAHYDITVMKQLIGLS